MALTMLPTLPADTSLSAAAASDITEVRGQCASYEGTNAGAQTYDRWSKVINSYLFADGEGYLRVQGDAVSGKLLAEYYSSDFTLQNTVTVDLDLPIFGGFYSTGDSYYVLTGQNNKSENNSTEVFRITKYDKNWNKLGSSGLYGANTTKPFDAGTARFTQSGKYLLVRTSHEMYTTDDGINHQSNVTIQFDMDAMKITDSFSDIMNTGYGYVSHSFNQFIRTDGTSIVAADHGDASPRSAVLIKYNTDFTKGTFVPDYYTKCSVVDMLTYPEHQSNYNITGGSMGGFEVTSSDYITAMNSVDQADITNNTTRNIFVARVSKDLGTKTVTQVTNYAEGTETASTPQLVKINDDELMLLWTREGKVNYAELGADGAVTSDIYSFEGELSDCQPIAANGKVSWYIWNDGDITFNSIDLGDISKHSTKIIHNGHDYVTKNATKTNGTVTQTCKVCGYVNTFTVDTTFKSWYRTNADTGYFWSSPESSYAIGNTLDIMVYGADGDTVDMKKKYVVELSDDIAVQSNPQSYYTRLTFTKNGSVTLKVYPKYNPDAAHTFTIVCGHAHHFNTGTITTQPTCTEKGVRTRTCTICGEKRYESIAATGHKYNAWKETKAATCTAAGTQTRTCSVCKNVENKTIKAKGHTEVADSAVAATCTTDGKTAGSHCSVCGKVIKAQTVIKATGHKYGEWAVTKEPTCTAAGTQSRTCSVCKNIENKTIKAKGHTEVADSAVAATCTTDGKTAGSHCSVCGKVIKAQTVIKATGHKYGSWTVTKAATCTEDGSQKRSCTVCGNTETQTIKATGHKASGWMIDKQPDIGVKGSKHKECTVCGKVLQTAEIPALGAKDISGAKVTVASKVTFTGTSRKPAVTVMLSGKELVKNTDYTVKYSNNKAIGKATVTITGKGKYTGVIKKTFKIVPMKQVITSVTAKTKAFAVKWTKDLNVHGYQIKYSTKSNFSGGKSVYVKKNTTVSKTFTGLTAKKTYYVKVRSYKTVNGTKYYSSWSSAKKVKTK
ncbi:fibronectin type III domain protein [Ruminococcus sp. CAG:579]|nr:fibronectin type III domain protein [Ruminococcus sp. CAG:579]